MKKFIYLFTLFALCISLTIAHAASPTYDDEPPSYIWGSGGLNAQTSGTPNKSGEDRIIEAIENMDGGVGSISIDTSAIESYLHVGDGQTATSTITDLINGIGTDTGNIEAYLKKTDGENTVTITDLINSIGTDTSKIKQDVSNLAKTAQPSEFRTTRLTGISASTATQINVITDLNSTATNRVFVELRAIDSDTEFYIGFDNTVTDSTGRPVKGRILLNMPSTQTLYIYHTNESAIDIQQTEGWR